MIFYDSKVHNYLIITCMSWKYHSNACNMQHILLHYLYFVDKRWASAYKPMTSRSYFNLISLDIAYQHNFCHMGTFSKMLEGNCIYRDLDQYSCKKVMTFSMVISEHVSFILIMYHNQLMNTRRHCNEKCCI